MADPETPETPGVVAVDSEGWETESFGHELPSRESVVADLSDGEPVVPAAPKETPTAAPAGDDEAPAQETEASDDTPGEKPPAKTERVRGADGKFKRVSASERIALQQAQINANTRQRHELDEQIAARKAELEDLDRRRAKGTPATPAAERPETAPTETPGPKPAPVWDEYREQDKTWKEYEADLQAWTREEAINAVRREREQEQRTANERHQAELRDRWEADVKQKHAERVAKAREQHPDYAEVVGNLAHIPQTPFIRDVVRLHDQGAEILYYFGQNPEHCEILSELPMTTSMMTAVRESSSPTALLTYFATHPAEVVQLSRKPQHAALWQLAQLDRSLTAQGDGVKTGSPTPAPISNAKPPIGHLTGSRAVATSRPEDELDDDPNEDPAEYVKRKNASERARGLR